MEPFLESVPSSRFESLNRSFDLCKDFNKKKPETSVFNSKSESVELGGFPEAVETRESPRSGSVKWGIHEKLGTMRSKADWDLVNSFSEIKKTCVDCQTAKTPLWRSGPAGPKSLCNACGIRYRKKRRAALGMNTEQEERKKKVGVSLKLRLLALGGDFFVQKKRKLAKEEEEAAVLLMALSCGFIHA